MKLSATFVIFASALALGAVPMRRGDAVLEIRQVESAIPVPVPLELPELPVESQPPVPVPSQAPAEPVESQAPVPVPLQPF